MNDSRYSLKVKQTGSRVVYWLDGTIRGDELIPQLKQAGFWFHSRARCTRPRCSACEAGIDTAWWTLDERVARSVEWAADAETAARWSGRADTIKASRAVDADIDIPAPDGCHYLPYQKGGIKFALDHARCLIGDEMGLGKTIQALGVVNADPAVTSVLVICPASIKINWAREAKKWLTRPFVIQIVSSRDLPDPAATFVVVNYDLLSIKPDLVKALKARRWGLLVIDESHRVKDDKAARTRAILGRFNRDEQVETGLFDQADRVVALTGTPAPNRPIELWSVVSRLAPGTFPNRFKFAIRYCGAYQDRFGWHFDGSSNEAELQSKLRGSILVRRVKSDVLTELPPKRRQLLPLPANGATELLSRERAVAADIQSFADCFDGLNGRTESFEELSRLRRLLAVSKIEKVVEHVRDLLEGGLAKVVVFGHHREVLAGLVEGLQEFGVVVLSGETEASERQQAVDRFQTDPAVRVFVGSIQAGGVGLTLTAADTCVFAELDWVPGNVQQAEDRLHRIGQRGNVLVQYLVYDDSLEARLAQTVASKEATLEAVLDRQGEVEPDAPALQIAKPAARPVENALPPRHPLVDELERLVEGEVVPF